MFSHMDIALYMTIIDEETSEKKEKKDELSRSPMNEDKDSDSSRDPD